MRAGGLLPVDRFLDTLHVVYREGVQLNYSWRRLSEQQINAEWVLGLAERPELAERLEAFVSRFGRMQDTIGEKLLPRWLLAVAETPGSLIETLNRAERLGVLSSVEQWLEARKLRNRLVHEYMTDAVAFAEDLSLALGYCHLLVETYGRIRDFAGQRMLLAPGALPDSL